MSNINKVLTHLSTLSSDIKGRAFETYCKWFLENDPTYALQIKKVWLWKDWPENWGRDKGIDLIAQTHSGKIWAIQAKAYDTDRYITKEDVDTFLSESSRKIISFRLLIATTNNIGVNAQEVITGQEKPVSLCLLYNLEGSPVEWPIVLTSSIPVIKKEIRSLYPHQQRAVEDVFVGLQKSSYGQVYMACGTGKTLVGLSMVEKLRSHITLVLVPSILLVSQLYMQWARYRGEAFNFYPIFVCSDKTVGDKEEADVFVEKSVDLGFPVTTNVQDLLQEIASATGPVVVFSTYHSSRVIKEACALNSSLIFDFAIADEAHRCVGPANSDFAIIVDKEAIRTKHKLFMTATPKIFADHVKKTTKDYDYEIVSMDDSDKFGPVFHKLLFSDAIRDGLLSDYQVIISVIDNKTYQEYAEKGRFVAIDEHKTDARTLASQIMVAKAIKRYKLTRIISFHSRTKSARVFVESLPQALSLVPENEHPEIHFKDMISGDMPQSDRSKILKRFKESRQGSAAILANVRCLSEGVDVPTLDGIVFIDPKGSEIDIIQSVGRAIRKAPDKKIGTIIIPVFIDNVADELVALQQSCFKAVWRVVKAMRAHDDVLAEELDTIRLELGKRTYKSPPKLSKITIDVPIGIGIEFSEALKVKIVENIIEHCTSTWNYQFGLLKEFRKMYPDRWPTAEEEFPLANQIGHWCSVQRQNFKKKMLTQAKIDNLNSIGFSWDPLNDAWEYGYNLLVEFVNQKGHAMVPKDYKVNNFALGIWVSTQRFNFAKQELSQEKIDRLNALSGWVWNIRNYKYKAVFEALDNFVKREGHAFVPTNHIENGFPLGKWVSRFRLYYSKNELDTDMKAKLESYPDWFWDANLGYWEMGARALIKFCEQYQHSLVKNTYIINGFALGKWCQMYRYIYKQGKLAQEQINFFEALPKWSWDIKTDQWKNGLIYLQKYFEREGHAKVPSDHIEDKFTLGTWCNTQRYAYSLGKLVKEKIEILESLSGWSWNKLEEIWNVGFHYLQQFVVENGHANVPARYQFKGYKLGTWVQSQRYNFQKGILPQDRISILENMPGWTWGAKEEKWIMAYNKLLEFYKRKGHAKVPFNQKEDGFNLGEWVLTQRKVYKSGGMQQDRIVKLEALNGWCWDTRQ